MTTILIKKKDTTGAPAPGDLTNSAGGAEIAVNTSDLKIYTKNSGGTIVQVGSGPSATDTLTNKTINLANNTLTATSAQLAAAVTDETGTGALVFATSPTLVTPALGTPASGVVTNLTGTASININGTVGATTPNTGAFTTLVATTNLSSTRINPRVSSTTSTATLTPDVSAFDQYNLTAQAAGLTIAAPTGTPVDGNKLIIRILDNGTPRALTWNATYTVIGTTLPTTTTASKMTYVGCIYNTANTRWDVVAVTTQA